MRDFVEDRIKQEADYMIQTNVTIRDVAKHFYISKSTVYLDLAERLKLVDPELHAQVNKILQTNKMERHIRGAEATKRKYIQLKTCRTRNALV